jgi:hypothetical protein
LTIKTDDGFIGSEIKCYKRDGKIYYPDSTSNCFKFTGISDNVNEENPFIVYPNPTGSLVEIKSNLKYRIAKVNVLNICGSVISTFNVDKEPEAKISVQGISPGTYFLEITTDLNKRFYTKIIKQ